MGAEKTKSRKRAHRAKAADQPLAREQKLHPLEAVLLRRVRVPERLRGVH